MKPQSTIFDMKIKENEESQLVVAEYSKVNRSVILSYDPLKVLNFDSKLEDNFEKSSPYDEIPVKPKVKIKK